MKAHAKSPRFLLAGIAFLLLPLNAHAVCSSTLSFAGYYSLLTGTTSGPSLRSSFWILNQGDIRIGLGMDNGSAAESGSAGSDGWLINYGPFVYVISNWAALAGVDGCPDPAIPPASQGMAIAFSNVDGTGKMKYAVMCSSRDTQRGAEFEFDFPSGCDGPTCQPITMALAPQAMISGTTRTAGQANITVASPNFAPGFYSDGTPNCSMNAVIPQFDVYKQEIPRGAPAPTNADVTSGWVLVGTGNIGSPFTFTTSCVGDCDVYVATVPGYDSRFRTGEPATGAPDRVGPPSARVQSGPILADPPRPRTVKPKRADD